MTTPAPAAPYLHPEVLGSEQWFFAGAKVCQVIDPRKESAPPFNGGIVHQSSFVLPRTRCRIWALLHGYGWLPVKP